MGRLLDNLTGKYIGSWFVEGRADNRGRKPFWRCRCACGTIKEVAAHSLQARDSTRCRRCLFKQLPNNRFRTKWSHILQTAKRRNIPVLLTPDYALSLFNQQHGRCALTGVEISFHPADNLPMASLDRINNQLPYQEGNVWWVQADVNIAKQKFSPQRFLEICRQVTEYNAARTNHQFDI